MAELLNVLEILLLPLRVEVPLMVTQGSMDTVMAVVACTAGRLCLRTSTL